MSDFDPRERNRSRIQKVLQRLFPEQQIMLRSAEGVSSLRLTTAVQGTACAAALLLAGWTGFTSWVYLSYDSVLAGKQEDVARAQAMEQNLQARVVAYSEQIGKLSGELEENHRRMLEIQASAVGEKGAVQASRREAQHGLAETERKALREQLTRLGEVLAKAPPDTVPAADPAGAALRQAITEKELAVSENGSLQQRLRDLEARVVDMNATQMTLVERFSSVVGGRTAELESALNGTGLRLEDLKDKHSSAQGGPFIPLASVPEVQGTVLGNGLAGLGQSYDRWDGLKRLSDRLPLAEPLRDYHLTSLFGARRDPVNGEGAFHPGLDMAGDFMTPIHATAPGRVVYAGWRGRYGRLVEVDHGNGIRTRFGHLQKIAVRKGERVDRSTIIGNLGSSGRSTGPHLHYEVLVNGQPRNPSIFIKAGSNVL